MIAPNAATTSIWEKGRRYLIMVLAPADSAAVGALDIAAHSGLRTVAILNQNALLPKAVAKGTNDIAKSKGLEVVFFETYPDGTADFSGILNKVRATNPDVVVPASIRLDDLVTITRQMRETDFNTKMVAVCLMVCCPNTTSGSERTRNSCTAPPFGRGRCPTPETTSSSQRMRRNSTAPPPFSRPTRTPDVRFLWRRYNGPGLPIPRSSEKFYLH